MGVIQSFERRLQGAVGNTFARLFGGTVQPAEVADALQREAADHVQHQGDAAIAPNSYRVRLGPTDRQGLGADEVSVASALSDMIREYLVEQGWQTFGDVSVTLEQSDSLHTGQFRISSIVDPDVGRRSPQARSGVGPMTQQPGDGDRHPQQPPPGNPQQDQQYPPGAPGYGQGGWDQQGQQWDQYGQAADRAPYGQQPPAPQFNGPGQGYPPPNQGYPQGYPQQGYPNAGPANQATTRGTRSSSRTSRARRSRVRRSGTLHSRATSRDTSPRRTPAASSTRRTTARTTACRRLPSRR